jgi:lipopolysaccharide transport system ATP-binding protein
MNHPVISVENLSKRYIIGHQRNGRDGLRHAIEEAFRNPLKWLKARRRNFQATREEFWALKDVSFEIRQGDVVGIIGRNGAGKSTLLKVLSRITEPTKGQVRIRGRVASLLEVGTGFHPELTGRENIYLNGAILGMRKAEIRSKFDEIVAFSEIERFLDTPVKRYSSGMYVRLAFAVAAHLEPEILIVDEVLAVGDAAFQKKCLGKMGGVARGGRTVLFVSHNMPAVQALCNRGILLQNGSVKTAGPIESAIEEYLMQPTHSSARRDFSAVELGNSLRLTELKVEPNPIETGDPVHLTLRFLANESTTIADLSMLFTSSQNTRVAILDLRGCGVPIRLQAGETCEVTADVRSIPFVEGDYAIGIYVSAGVFQECLSDVNTLTVHTRSGGRDLAPYLTEYRGLIELDFTPKLFRDLPQTPIKVVGEL